MDWERHYATYPLTIGRTDYLAQVGHTVNGKPISDEQFRWIISRIKALLDVQPSDHLLDLCCGNGLITRELAADVEHVTGVDFSEPLLAIAAQDHRPANVSYELANVLDLQRAPLRNSRRFDKIVMYGALQHFKKKELELILENIAAVSADKKAILLGFVPNKAKKWSFYDSPRRKLAHFIHRARGLDRMGTWWEAEYIRAVCKENRLRCGFHRLDPMLHASRYRFDVLITSRNTD